MLPVYHIDIVDASLVVMESWHH